VRAVDTNLLVFAEITTSPSHQRARDLVRRLAEGPQPWAIPWPSIYEFLRIVTHPRVYHPPMPIEVAIEDLTTLLASPSLVLLRETERHFAILKDVVSRSGVSGNLVYDAHIAALCIEHGVAELLTADRDFARFPGLRVTNPLEPPGASR
jgi:hypothetical protein